MKTYEYRKIDAFTTGKSLGNPAACIYLEREQSLSDEEMLDIAKQHKGFVSDLLNQREIEIHTNRKGSLIVYHVKKQPLGWECNFY